MKIKYGLALLAIFGVSLALRIYFSYPHVLQDGFVNYQETDCYHNMRLVALLAQNFPHMPTFDPYGFYPSGMPTGYFLFFYYLFAFVAWVVGLGHPTLHTIEMVGAYLPAILGALVTIPVYFLGKEVFSRRAGLLAAALIAILPGQFLWRSTLGFPDYHILEVLLSTTTLVFLIMALNRSGKRVWLYSLLAGIALGLYLLSWSGSILFIMIIFAALVLYSVVSHLRAKPSPQLHIVAVVMFATSLVLVLASNYGLKSLPSLSLAVGIATFASSHIFLSTVGKRAPKAYYPLALVVLGLGALGLLSLVPQASSQGDTTLFREVMHAFGRFKSVGGMLTVAEAKGITLSAIWNSFALCFYIGFASLVLIVYQAIKELNVGKLLLVVWSAVILIATFQQNRFAYYLAVPIALLTAYACAKLIDYVQLIAPKRKASRAVIRRKSKKGRNKAAKGIKKRKFSPQLAYSLLAMLVIALAVFLPCSLSAVNRVKADTGMGADWHTALVWLRDNTPEPLTNSTYTEIVPANYTYPDSAYGVLSWWDYGYFITYVAHRIPNANPGGMGYKDAGMFFTSGNESEANEILHKIGSRYIIIDQAMAGGKFYAMAIWANRAPSNYMDVYYYKDEAGLYQPVMLYYPAYYETMCSRLYNFNGQATTPTKVLAVSWQASDVNGNTVRLISDVKQFDTYDAAKQFIAANPRYIIASDNPTSTPVPLEELSHYKLLYQSNTVKIFEFN